MSDHQQGFLHRLNRWVKLMLAHVPAVLLSWLLFSVATILHRGYSPLPGFGTGRLADQERVYALTLLIASFLLSLLSQQWFRWRAQQLLSKSTKGKSGSSHVSSSLTSQPLEAPESASNEQSGSSSPRAQVSPRMHPVRPESLHSERARQQMTARLTPQLRWHSVSPPLLNVLGMTPDHLHGQSILELIHKEDVGRVEKALRETFVEGETHNVILRITARSNGSDKFRLRFFRMTAIAYLDAEGHPMELRCHFVNVTEPVLAEHALRRRTQELEQVNSRLRKINLDLQRLKESYRDLYHHAPVMYFSVNDQGQMVGINETLLATLGYQRTELLTQPYSRLLSPSARQLYLKDPAILQREGESETQWVKKDGTIIDVWVGNSVVLDDTGTFHRSRSAARDVTERNLLALTVRERARALQAANVQLRRINQELEDFTYVVSHDLKEPLRTIEAFCNFLGIDCGPELSELGREHLSHVIEASQRLGRLIEDLLRLSRAGRVIGTPRELHWEELVGIVLGDLRHLQEQSPHATIHVQQPIPAAQGDPERIIMLLVNLVSNGIKYNESPHPTVTFGGCEDTEDFIRFFVKDNGIGIESRYHEKIFGIFQRLHAREQYEGTGAGLAICRKIVEAHGGRMWLESEPGQGSTFYFTLPRCEPISSQEVSEDNGAVVIASRG